MPGTGLSTPHTLNLDGLAQQKKTKLMQSLTCSRPCQYQVVEPELKLSLSDNKVEIPSSPARCLQENCGTNLCDSQGSGR